MIQLNLLPDVKAKYIKAQRNKHMVVLSSVAICGVALGIVFLMVTYVYAGQKLRLSGLQSDIKKNSNTLKNIEGLDKILTIQNQLNSLTSLHKAKPVATRLATFLPQLTPTEVQISNLTINFDESTIQITGSAKSLEAVNKFADTLKFTKFYTDQSQDNKNAFSEVVLTSFSVGSGSSGGVTYSISAKFDSAIFSSDYSTVTLVVPKITSTRSQTEQPDALFKTQPTNTGSTQ